MNHRGFDIYVDSIHSILSNIHDEINQRLRKEQIKDQPKKKKPKRLQNSGAGQRSISSDTG